MTIWRVRVACWIPRASDTHSGCHTYCFATATMDARKRLNFTLHVHCESCKAYQRLRKFFVLFFKIRMYYKQTILVADFGWMAKTMDIFVSTKSVYYYYYYFKIRFRVGGCRPAASPVGVQLSQSLGLSSKRYMRTAVVS